MTHKQVLRMIDAYMLFAFVGGLAIGIAIGINIPKEWFV